MIDNVIKKYLQINIINKKNIGCVSGKTPSIKRYFKLPFIGMYSKVTQNKIEKLCTKFCKNVKVRVVFTSDKSYLIFIKDFIQVFSVQRSFINLFVLAVMLVMLVKHTDT